MAVVSLPIMARACHAHQPWTSLRSRSSARYWLAPPWEVNLPASASRHVVMVRAFQTEAATRTQWCIAVEANLRPTMAAPPGPQRSVHASLRGIDVRRRSHLAEAQVT